MRIADWVWDFGCPERGSTNGPSGEGFDISVPLSYHLDVRTTLTLDEDVAAKLKAEMRQSGKSFKETVNEFLRRGLNARAKTSPEAPFRVRARPLGLKAGLSYDNVWELIEQIEEPETR